MNDEDLKMKAFGEGIPPSSDETPSGEIQTIQYTRICKIQSFRRDRNSAIQTIGRQTGADCDGEEEDMVFPDGKTYPVLQDTKNCSIFIINIKFDNFFMNSKTYNGLSWERRTYLLCGLVEGCCIILHTSSKIQS